MKAHAHESKYPPSEMEAAWKLLNRSEPQLGAYVFAYLNTFKRAPKLLRSKDSEIRNAVVHQGKIPSREEAIDFGQRVLEIIRPAFREANDAFPNGVLQVTLGNPIERGMKAGDGSSFMATILQPNTEDRDISLRDWLPQVSEWRARVENRASLNL